MKANGSLGSTIRLLAGIVCGSLVASEVLAYLVMLISAMLALTNGESEALLYVVLGLIPFVFVLIVLSFLYVLAIGFAQMVDDVHAVREHTVPSEAAPKEVTPTATVNRYFGTAPTQKKPSAKEAPAPKSAPAVEVALSEDRCECGYKRPKTR